MSDTPDSKPKNKCPICRSNPENEWIFDCGTIVISQSTDLHVTANCVSVANNLMLKLEHEFNSVSEDRNELIEEVKSLKETILDQEHHIMELERLRRYSPGPHMGQD